MKNRDALGFSEMESKTLKLSEIEEEEDRLSDLPDSIIQHILSFSLSTREAIQTSVLSKRWHKQWTCLPDLFFDYPSGMSSVNLHESIDNTLILHDRSKTNKFHLYYSLYPKKDPHFAAKICFATTKNVDDLYLSSFKEVYELPEFLFNYASLVNLTTEGCILMPNGKVHWECLTHLSILHCKLTDQALEHILSGTPSLISLELISSRLLKSIDLAFDFSEKIVIASKSLKKLRLKCNAIIKVSVLEISCPNLEKLSVKGVGTDDPELFSRAIGNVLSVSLLLESFKLSFCCGIEQLVIASPSLKRLLLRRIESYFDIEISCPQLEELELPYVRTAKLLDLPSSLCAAIHFDNRGELNTRKRMIQDIMQQLQHVDELKIGDGSIEVLSAMKVRDRFSPVLNIKCLTLTYPSLKKHHSGIGCLLRISPLLEELVIIVPCLFPYNTAKCKIKNNYWISNATVYDCLESHLKTIKIKGFPGRHRRRELMLNFVQFLLDKAKVLEKMVVELYDDNVKIELSEILLSLPRCSQNAVIEVV